MIPVVYFFIQIISKTHTEKIPGVAPEMVVLVLTTTMLTRVYLFGYCERPKRRSRETRMRKNKRNEKQIKKTLGTTNTEYTDVRRFAS